MGCKIIESTIAVKVIQVAGCVGAYTASAKCLRDKKVWPHETVFLQLATATGS